MNMCFVELFYGLKTNQWIQNKTQLSLRQMRETNINAKNIIEITFKR